MNKILYKDVSITDLTSSLGYYCVMYSNSKTDYKKKLKTSKNLTSLKSWITRNKRFYHSYELDHYTRERKDIYHTTKFY